MLKRTIRKYIHKLEYNIYIKIANTLQKQYCTAVLCNGSSLSVWYQMCSKKNNLCEVYANVRLFEKYKIA